MAGPSDARRRYRRDRYLATRAGTWKPHMDPEPLTAHIEALLAQGMSKQAIAERSGISQTTIMLLSKRRLTRVRVVTGEAILGVHRVKQTRGQRHPVAPTKRRIGALAAMGWPLQQIGVRLGWKPYKIMRFMERDDNSFVWHSTVQAVREVYDELAMRDGHSMTARAWAQKHGWPPPLAWDDDVIDDPDPRVHAKTLARHIGAALEVRCAWCAKPVIVTDAQLTRAWCSVSCKMRGYRSAVKDRSPLH